MRSPIESNAQFVSNGTCGRLIVLSTALRPVLRRLLEAYVLFPLFAAMLLVLTWTTVIHLISAENVVAQNAAAELSRELADTYQAQMVRNLVSIDQTLKTVKYAYEMKGGAGLSELRDKGLLPPAIVFKVAIVGTDGRLSAATLPQASAAVTVADQPYFQTQRDSADDAPMPFVSEVTRDPGTGSPEITFSRRLQNAAGGFAGVVILSVDPGYFTSSYDYARMGKDGVLALLGTDGIVRAEQVGEQQSWGERLSSTAVRAAAAASTDLASIQPWDHGAPRYTNIRTLHGFPLIAIVGLGREEQAAQLRRHRRAYLLWAGGGSVVLVMLAFVLSRLSWQLAVSRQRARRAQQTYYAASEASLDAFFVFRSERGANGEIVDFVLTDTNRRGGELSGMHRGMLVGKSLDVAFPRCRDDGMFDKLVSVALTAAVEEHEWIHERPGMSSVWLQRQVVRVEDGVVAIIRDISSRKRAEVRRAEQNRVLEMIATSTPLEEVLSYMTRLLESQIAGSVCVALLCDEDGQHLKLGAAPSFPEQYHKQIHGSVIGPDAEPSGRAIHWRQPVYISDVKQDRCLLQQMEGYGMHDYGACWALPILSHDGSALGALTLFVRDPHEPAAVEAQAIAMATRICGIAIERSQAEERIRHMANHDALTGLPNRTLLSDRLNQVLLHAQRYQRGVTVVFIDLDNFKLINDSLGHRAGDDLLKTVAARMVQCVRRTDTVVRLGGDEFVIVLFDQALHDGDITAVIEKIRDTILEPIELNGQTFQVTCSMGLASYPNDGTDAETLLMNADAAMYRAKERGRNNYQLYTAEMNIKVHDRLRLQEQLRHALANGEFRLVYQPQVDLRTEKIFGVEALLRWDHPTDGPVFPATFISLAEETGLIVPIGDWVLHTACCQNKAWQDAGMPPMSMSVNVSARQFQQKEWVARVAHALSTSGLDAQYLELELTESLIMQDLDGAIATMTELQAMGVRLSIDDFGTGYSSLSALKHFPIVRLKIDQSFVRELPDGEDNRAIARAVISLGRQLNLKVIAEGVETERQLDFLRDNDCHEIQGYHYSKPVSPSELERLVREPFTWPVDAAAEDVPS
ncbi:EAL domain protein (plasmid) [Caballeronia sp. SBC1]|uniref:bifunctional diguanylate cyclase/phosphodiesterase n=1 Tax=unclassified Caballeronia TaxID=2646786 RepID=UPI0013E1A96F|nr:MULTISPECIES: EAL domain-containing protein [unclassified Caballeronia]QIE29942.1 EAL domain protein [Caballeronia sp. SBC2]QIN67653.1 EAL domain protein [Caballeronia sp. SBC1]